MLLLYFYKFCRVQKKEVFLRMGKDELKSRMFLFINWENGIDLLGDGIWEWTGNYIDFGRDFFFISLASQMSHSSSPVSIWKKGKKQSLMHLPFSSHAIFLTLDLFTYNFVDFYIPVCVAIVLLKYSSLLRMYNLCIVLLVLFLTNWYIILMVTDFAQSYCYSCFHVFFQDWLWNISGLKEIRQKINIAFRCFETYIFFSYFSLSLCL